MTNAIEDSSETSLRAAILHYFQFVSSTSAASTGAEWPSPVRNAKNDKKQGKDTGSDPRGSKVLAALLEEFPELAKFTAPLLPVPELKVRFDAYPFNMSRLNFLESRLAFLEQRQTYSLMTGPRAAATNASVYPMDPPYTVATNFTGIKSKEPPYTALMAKKNYSLTTGSPAVARREAKATSSNLSASPSADATNATGEKRKDPPYTALVKDDHKKDQKKKQKPSKVDPQLSKNRKQSIKTDSDRLKKKVVSLTWEERYEQLKHYQKGYFHCRVPASYTAVPGLSHWVQRQRAKYRQQGLTPDQITKLNDIGFEWLVKEVPSKSWEDRFEDLKEFQREHGHTRVPRAYKPDPALGDWVHSQRGNFRDKSPSLMETDRLTKLQGIGFEFKVDKGHKSWDERYEQLVDFRRKYGHTNVPPPMKSEKDDAENGEKGGYTRKSQNDDYRFALWVQSQTTPYWNYKSGDRSAMTHARFKKLDDIGFGGEK